MKSTIRLVGELDKGFKFDYKGKNGDLYCGTLKTKRLSGIYDYVPITINEAIYETIKGLDFSNSKVEIIGDLRTFNKPVNDKSKLVIHVIGGEITLSNEDYMNQCLLEGFICRKPIFRTTPLGKDICDILLAVPIGKKSSYLPLIFWGDNAEIMSNLECGDYIAVAGRFQSREYTKLGEETARVAYEISVSDIIEIIKKSDMKD